MIAQNNIIVMHCTVLYCTNKMNIGYYKKTSLLVDSRGYKFEIEKVFWQYIENSLILLCHHRKDKRKTMGRRERHWEGTGMLGSLREYKRGWANEEGVGRKGGKLPLSGPICKSVPGCWILINVLVTRKRAGDAII